MTADDDAGQHIGLDAKRITVTPKGYATVLRSAADTLDKHAARATPGPWEIEYTYYGDKAQAVFVGCDDDHPDGYDGTRGIGGFDSDGDNRWAVLTGPQIAAPLAAWLRSHADRTEAAQCPPHPGAVQLALAIINGEGK